MALVPSSGFYLLPVCPWAPGKVAESLSLHSPETGCMEVCQVLCVHWAWGKAYTPHHPQTLLLLINNHGPLLLSRWPSELIWVSGTCRPLVQMGALRM